jgi:hypothetical protein
MVDFFRQETEKADRLRNTAHAGCRENRDARWIVLLGIVDQVMIPTIFRVRLVIVPDAKRKLFQQHHF